MIRFTPMLLALLLAILPSVATPQESSTPRKEDAVFTLMTYNIHHGEGVDGKLDVARIAEVVRTAAPDIVCLQEVDRNVPRSGNRDIAAELAGALGMAFVFGENLALDGGAYGNAILSRFPILAHENIPLPGPEGVEPRGCLTAQIEVHGEGVWFFNTHLGLKADERLAQATALLEHLPKGAPVVLAGDLNERLEDPGLKKLATVLKAALTAPSCDQPNSYPVPKPKRRIDHVFTGGGPVTQEACVLVTDASKVASDHFPVVAKIAN